MSSIFTKIINREFKSYIVDETSDYIAILAKDQIQPGHTLVIPKVGVDNYLDMTSLEYSKLQDYVHSVASMLKKAYPDKSRIVMNIVGFEVPHCHVHLIPANSIDEAFHTEPKNYSEEEMTEILKLILDNK